MTTDPHIAAEEASVSGRARSIAIYLKKYRQPNIEVLLNIARYLRGDDPSWTLRFISRGGRPPKIRTDPQQSMWVPGAEGALSTTLEMVCRASRTYPQVLLMHADLVNNLEVRDLIGRLADVLDPDIYSAGKWKLVFKRPRRGNPRTDLQTEIADAVLKQAAEFLKTKEGLKTDSAAHDRLHAMDIIGSHSRRLRRATKRFNISRTKD